MLRTPPVEPLQQIVHRCLLNDVSVALGGSGLLYALGLHDKVNDWDLTTEAPFTKVWDILSPYGATLHGATRRAHDTLHFRSEYVISLPEYPVEVIGRFAMLTQDGVCHLPTRVSGEWSEIPLASPEVWAVAYDLMRRSDKSDSLFQYLEKHGANQELLRLMMAEPVPPALFRRLSNLDESIDTVPRSSQSNGA